MTLDEIMALSPVIAVVTLKDAAHAAPLAHALVAGGIRAIEITLRTPAGLPGIRAAAAIAGAVVGAGTCLTPADVAAAADAGARFAVSPGATPALLDGTRKGVIPLLPGIATASEIMAAKERGLTHLKFFPAEVSGGAPALKAIAGPFPDILFCPTGGITAANAASYLSLPNVACVGGSWIAPDNLVSGGRWDAIESLAREASGLSR